MFLNPLGLLALLGVPAVLGLHLFRRRFRRHPVSAVFLWEARDHVPVAGRKREPFRSNPSFWFEILAALLIAMAIAGLRVFGAGEARHLVVVLDASASMGAQTEDGSLRELALDVLRERVAVLSRSSRVTVIASGARPELLAGPAAFTEEALNKAEAYTPARGRHDLSAAVGLAQQLAGEDEAVVLITDQFRPDAWPEQVELVALGAPTDNLGITHATRRRAPDEVTGEPRDRVHLAVTNFGFTSVETDVSLVAGGELLTAKRVALGPGERRHVAFTLPSDAPVVEARLPDDALAIDNVAYLAAEPPRTLALASTLPDDLARTLGIAGRDGSSVGGWLTLVPDSIEAPGPAAAHVVVSQGIVPGGAWCLSFETAGEERQHLIGPFLVDKQHPLLDGVTLEGIVWSASEELALRGAPVVSAGNRPLVTEGRDGDRIVFRANLDPRSSSLHRSPDWPILLANLAEMRRRELPGPSRTSLRIGETFLFRDRAPAEYDLVDTRGQDAPRRLRANGTLAVEDVARPGTYTLERVEPTGERAELCAVAFSFVDAAESDLRGLSSGEREADAVLASVLASHSWIEILLVVAVLALLALDWFVLAGANRRLARALEEDA